METATKHLGFSVIFIYFSSPFPKACVGDYKGTLPPYRDENSAPRALSHLVYIQKNKRQNFLNPKAPRLLEISTRNFAW